MKKLAIISSKYLPIIDAIKSYLKDVEVEYFENMPEKQEDFDLIAGIRFQTEKNILNSHFSLLPAFNSENPVEEAILAGVKVSGVSIYYTNPMKIIAQYPMFITNDKHFDDIEQELEYIEQTLYPVIIEKILNNEQFEVKDLMKKNCSHNCSSCGGCSTT